VSSSNFFTIAKWTEEEAQTKTCSYVYAKHERKNEESGSVYKLSEGSEQSESKWLGSAVLVVETFVDESVCRN
jgi:hypothetical protein